MDKIVVISNMYPSKASPNYGVFVKRFVEGLNKVFNVNLIVIRGRKRSYIQKFWSYIIFYIKIFFVVFSTKGKCLFYIHYANHSLLPFCFLPKHHLSYVIVNFHGGDLFPESKLAKFLTRYTFRIIPKVKGIIVPSEYFKFEVANRLNVSVGKIFVSPSGGVDCGHFVPLNSECVDRNSLSIGYVGRLDKVKIGYVGRLDEGKGFDILLNAFIELKLLGEKVELHVVGGGSLYEEYKSIVRRANIHKEVCFYGMLAHNELPKVISCFDVFVFPSIRESLGLVGIEALACGVPVIGSNIGGIATYVVDNYNGFLFNPGDKQDLVRLIKKFLRLCNREQDLLRKNARQSSLEFDQLQVRSELINYIRLKSDYQFTK